MSNDLYQLSNVKIKRKIAPNFLTFSGYMNSNLPRLRFWQYFSSLNIFLKILCEIGDANSKILWPTDIARVFQQPTYILMDDGKKNSMKIRVPQRTQASSKWGRTCYYAKPGFGQRYTYRVLQTIQMKHILLCVWAELTVLGSTKTALKFKYEIQIG